MAVLKCKMCGGDLNIGANESVGVCEFCGSKQTLPKLDNDRKNNLYDRANHFRRNNEYDKAMSIFENILNEDSTDAESYWSLVLCKYGIEYVEDPVSHKRVPTVNCAQFTSVFADENYKSALKYADASQRSVYEEEAKAIDEIQKGILAISQKEKPFDVFICYKETDASGSRTKDSVIATELYHELTKEGFKVFFSRITLEDKLGTAYEPYIFAALNSSKVMVVIGTKSEYFNAVWVKNEWSRYLALIRNGEKKMLIPAYRDMDPYDLPEEFSHLQAQDMSKLGFMQDLIRGIKKITAIDEPAPVTTVVKENVVRQAGGNATVDSLLKRVFIFLEDKDFTSANEYAEKVLDIDPENAQAYLGKLLADCKVDKLSNLVNYKDSFESNNNYQKVRRYGDKELAEKLEGFIKAIKDRNEEARKLGIYNDVVNLMNKAQTVADFNKAAEKFASISGYKDSAKLKEKCGQLAVETRKRIEYTDARSRMSRNTDSEYKQAIAILERIVDYKDSKELIEKCKAQIEELHKAGLYMQALSCCAGRTVEDQEKAIKYLEELKGYKDSESLIDSCRKCIEKINADEMNAKAAAIKKKKTMKIVSIAVAVLVALVVVFAILFNTVIMPNNTYRSALYLMKEERYIEAFFAFDSLDGYKDSNEKMEECNQLILGDDYKKAITLMDDGKYTEAIAVFESLDGYKDSKDKIEECNTAIIDSKYNDAVASIETGDIVEAYETLISLDGYKDSTEKANFIFDEYKGEKLKSAKVGDYVFFGEYEQDNNISNGKEDVEWQILNIEDDKALLISRCVLDCQQFNTTQTNATWENCTLREWLNNMFINDVFSKNDMSIILTSMVSADENPSSYLDSYQGNDTQDKLFLLSLEEFNEYFSKDNSYNVYGYDQCTPTTYAIENGVWKNSNGYCCWWLRTLGKEQNLATCVFESGSASEAGTRVNRSDYGVRPAMWIDLDKI